MNALVEERGRVWDSYQALLADASGREFTAEERSKFDQMDSELDRLRKAIDHKTQMRSTSSNTTTTIAMGGPVGVITSSSATEQRSEYEQRFADFLRDGTPIPTEMRTLQVGVDAKGGYTVPEGFRNKVIEKMAVYGGVRALAEQISTDSGNDLPYPTSDQTAVKGRLLAEGAQAPETDLTVGRKVLKAHVWTSDVIRVSNQLIQDTGIDLESWLASKMADRIGRSQADYWLTGTGTGQPEGLITGRNTALDVDLAAAGTITYAETIDLVHKPDIAYRDGASFVMHDTVMAAIRKIVDGQGRPMWEPSLQVNNPDRYLGYPIVIDNSMPAKTATAAAVQMLFGNIRRAYIVRSVKAFTTARLTELFIAQNETGFIGFERADGAVQDNSAYAALAN